jgi:hypothetical protein
MIYKTAKQRALDAYRRRYPLAAPTALTTEPATRDGDKCVRVINASGKKKAHNAVYAYSRRQRVRLVHEERV